MPFNRPISDNLQPSNEICLNTDKLLLEKVTRHIRELPYDYEQISQQKYFRPEGSEMTYSKG